MYPFCIRETTISGPEPVANLLNKGPNFRVPPKPDNRLMDSINLSLEVLTYRLRWFEALKMSSRNVPAKVKHENCHTCSSLPDNYTCNDRFIVYKFTCKICFKSYIGETCRPFHQRFVEHKRSLLARDGKSALSEHVNNHHANNLDIENFQLCVLSKLGNPIETRLKEAHLINTHRPQLNRRHELAHW